MSVKKNTKLKILLPFAMLISSIIVSVLFFHHTEDVGLFESLWMTIITILTIGYGDLIPVTKTGRIFTMVIVPVAILLFTYLMGQIIGLMIEINISPVKRSRRMEKKIKRLGGHIIICGYGPMTKTIIEKISEEKKDFVLIKPEENEVPDMPDHSFVIFGDPSEEEVLTRAGIEKAEGLITTRSDAENVLISLTARGMNPKINIVSSAERLESEPKLRKAGADRVINPERIGGTRLALSVLKPAAVDYMDKVFRTGHEDYRVEEIMLKENSGISGKSIKEAAVRNRFDISIMAVKRGGQIYTSDLTDMVLMINDILIVFGREESLGSFREFTRSHLV